MNSITCTRCRTDFKTAIHNPSTFLFPLSAKERWGLSIYVEGNTLRKNKSSKFEPWQLIGVLGIHFSTWMLFTTMSFALNVVTGSVDLCRVLALCISCMLLAFICKSLLGGVEITRIDILIPLTFEELTNFLYHT